jgi:hypothetical protein
VSILSNTRREKFAQILASGKSATEAHREAGFKPNRQNASRLAKLPEVRARIAELQRIAAGATEVSIASLIAELEEGRRLAREKGQAAAMVSATIGKARILGVLDEAPRQTVNVMRGIDAPPRETFAEWCERHQQPIPSSMAASDRARPVNEAGEIVNAKGETREQWLARRERELAIDPSMKVAAEKAENLYLKDKIAEVKAQAGPEFPSDEPERKIRRLS